MITGASVGMSGGGGVGMLRARRRDISIKPNRKLDRKSSRGMIYENEELRLRTIHINAEVEQGQNDIKKLRRENEQLRREIWSLRDEYDKLEEILKKQKSREGSDEPENRSEDEANGSEYSENDTEQDEEVIDDDESETEDDTADENNQEERLENAENQKISSEKMSNGTLTQHRPRINFDDLSVVDEEEELKKDKDKKEHTNEKIPKSESVQITLTTTTPQENHFPCYTTMSNNSTDPLTKTSFSYQTECPFVFLSSGEVANGYSNIMSLDGSRLLMTTCPQLYPGGTNQQPVIPLASLATPPLNPNLDINTHNHSHVPLIATPPPPAGWQSSVSIPPAMGTSITASNFPSVTGTQSPSRDFRLVSTKDLPLKPPEDIGVVENGRTIVSTQHPRLTSVLNSVEKRKAFFRQYADKFQAIGPRNTDNGVGLNTTNKAKGNCDTESKNSLEKSIDVTINGENTMQDASTSIDKPRHFFAPLPTKTRYPCNGDMTVRSLDDSSTTRYSNNGNSPSSETTASTVISRNRYNCEKGSADICVNGAIPYNAESQIEKGDAKAFFSSENLLIIDDMRNNESSNGSNNPLTKSISCQDLSSRLSFTENLKSSNNEQNYTKSDNTLDNISTSTKAFRSYLNVTLRSPRFRKSPSPDIPEIPKLPPIDYKLFNNPFLQNFEQAYQNFPVRTEGQSPVTHPLSIQVCESPVPATSYSSPVRIQPSFSGPNTAEPDCGTCKRKDLERLRLMIPPTKLLDRNGEKQEYHVTSFESPSPHTLQIPPMTPYELEALRKMPTMTNSVNQSSRLYQNVPFVWNSMRMYYDSVSKVPAQTQTSLEDEETTTKTEDEMKNIEINTESNQRMLDQVKKRHSRKEKSGSVKEKQKSSSSQKRKNLLKKQNSVSSKEIPEFSGKVGGKFRSGETEDDKNESRSSSSGQESPKKDQTKRVSLYLNTKKRPSLSSSIRTSRSRSVEKEKHLTRGEALLEGNAMNLERERTNSVSSREAGIREKTRKSSTSSDSVPWCACWGNGCI